jgi:predicted dehydrogenase
VNNRLRVGIAGCGFIGRKREQALDGDEFVGAYDLDPASVAALDAADPDFATLRCIDDHLYRRGR